MSLRQRSSPTESGSTPPVVPIDSAEQDRVIQEFLISKAQQDRLWKHFMSLLYGGSALLLVMMLACSLAMGCDPSDEVEAPFSGPRCTLFNLPSVLHRHFGTAFAANLSMVFALLVVVVWGTYSYQMDSFQVKSHFNQSQAEKHAIKLQQTAAASNDESKEAVEAALLTRGPSSMPFTKQEGRFLQRLQQVATILLVLWLLYSVALAAYFAKSLGPNTIIFLMGPTFLMVLTKLAAGWSDDIESQILELEACKYNFHEA